MTRTRFDSLNCAQLRALEDADRQDELLVCAQTQAQVEAEIHQYLDRFFWGYDFSLEESLEYERICSWLYERTSPLCG